MSRLNPRDSGEYIVKNAKYLKVNEAGIEKLTKEIIAGIKSGKIDIANFSQHELHPRPEDKNAIEWIFVVDTLNFCFWTPINHTKYKVQGYTGYFALCAAINRAIGEGYNMTDAAFYAKIDVDTLQHIFRSDDGETKVPLFEKRLECLHEVGERLLDKWQGKFENVVKAANKSALKLVELVVSEFPCFRDEAHYAGQRVALYKRAQILVGDLWACYRGEKMGEFKDIQSITMFADYRIPQVLVHFGTIVYGDGLMSRLKKEEIMQNGEAMEVELRGASIYVVERVKDAVLAELAKNEPKIPTKNVNAILIDHFLWDYRREHAAELEHIPFHKVLSVYY